MSYHNHHVLQADPSRVDPPMATPWVIRDGWLCREVTVSRDGFYRVFDQYTDEQDTKTTECYKVDPTTYEILYSHMAQNVPHALHMYGAINTDEFGKQTHTIMVWEYNYGGHYTQFTDDIFAKFEAWSRQQAMVQS